VAKKLYTASQKLGHYTFVHNFDKCRPIFKILLLLYSARNMQQNLCHIAYHASDMSQHDLAKCKKNENGDILLHLRQ